MSADAVTQKQDRAWSAEDPAEIITTLDDDGGRAVSVCAAGLATAIGAVAAAGMLYYHHVTTHETVLSAPTTTVTRAPMPTLSPPTGSPAPLPTTIIPDWPSAPVPHEHAPAKKTVPVMVPPPGLPLDDQRLLERMQQQNGDFVSEDSERKWVAWAHEACQALRAGADPEAVDHGVSQDAGVPLDEAMIMVGDAQLIYPDCAVGAQ